MAAVPSTVRRVAIPIRITIRNLGTEITTWATGGPGPIPPGMQGQVQEPAADIDVAECYEHAPGKFTALRVFTRSLTGDAAKAFFDANPGLLGTMLDNARAHVSLEGALP